MYCLRFDRRIASTSICLAAIGLATVSTAWAAKPQRLRFSKADTQVVEPQIVAQLIDPGVLLGSGPTQGQVEMVIERYPNGKAKVERQVTIDAEGNFVNHGTWKMWNTSAKVIAEGQYDMGQRVGTWTRWLGRNDAKVLGQFPFNRFKTPFIAAATFSDGKLDGEWLIVDADQRKCMQISLSMGERHGPVLTWLPNGKTYQQATYNHGVPMGDFFEAGKTGELKLAATYVDGRRLVTKTTYHEQNRQRKQKKTEELYLAATTVEKTPDQFWNLQFADYTTEGEAMRHGPSRAWYANGVQRHEGLYELGERSGTFTFWHPNGQVSVTGDYKDNLPNGLWVWWHEMGQKAAIGKYQEGTLLGKWRWWSDDGRLTKQTVYDDSDRVSFDPGEVLQLGLRTEESDTVTR